MYPVNIINKRNGGYLSDMKKKKIFSTKLENKIGT